MKLCCINWLLVLNAFLVSGQDTPYTASFIGRLGTDTVLVETYSMLNNHLYGKAFIRVPEDYIGQFSVHFYPDGSIREFNMAAMSPENSSVPFEAKTGNFEYRITMNCSGDSCIFYNARRGSTTEIVLKHKADAINFVGGWVPLISLMEWNCMRLVKSGSSLLPLKMINHYLGVYPINVHFQNAAKRDSIIFGGPFLEYTRIAVDKDGRIVSTNGIGTPWNYIVNKHNAIDIDRVASRMSKTNGIGDPSPQESIQTNIKNNRIELTYGRPFKRGRKIFGGVVPYDSIWRTGAGSATAITLPADIRIGKTTIPKGKYSLYTIPRPDSWTLIFNEDLNTWPTNPNRSKDLVSVIIPAGKTKSVTEQFTIEITQRNNGGVLALQWDDTRAFAEFVMAKK